VQTDQIFTILMGDQGRARGGQFIEDNALNVKNLDSLSAARARVVILSGHARGALWWKKRPSCQARVVAEVAETLLERWCPILSLASGWRLVDWRRSRPLPR